MGIWIIYLSSFSWDIVNYAVLEDWKRISFLAFMGVRGEEPVHASKAVVMLALVSKGLAVLAKCVCAVVIYELRPCDGRICVRGLWEDS